jgi:hypothetical protein
MRFQGRPVPQRFYPAGKAVWRKMGSFGRKRIPFFDDACFVCPCSLLVVLAWGGRYGLSTLFFSEGPGQVVA